MIIQPLLRIGCFIPDSKTAQLIFSRAVLLRILHLMGIALQECLRTR